MKKIFFILIIASVAKQSHSQGAWTQKASMPAPPRYDGIGFSIGTKGYVGVGNDCNSYVTDFWQYDPFTNAWTQKSNFTGGTSYQSVAFSIGLKGYIVAGISSNKLWEYDSSNDTWTQRANLPGSNRNACIGFAIGTKGYVGAGYSGAPSVWFKDFWEYDPQQNSWTQKASYSGRGRGFNFSLSVGSKGYVGTGRDSTQGFFDDFWEYNPALNLWNQKPNFPGGVRADIDGCRFSIGGSMYVGTGTTGVGSLNDFWKYDTLLNQWLQVSSFPIARIGACGFSIGNKGYIATGLGASNNCFNDLWEYCDTCLTTINESQNQISISVFPNPFSTQTTFTLSNSVQSASLKVFSISGEEAKNISFSGRQLILERGVLSSGVYFYQLISPSPAGEGLGEIIATGKLIIQ